MVKWSGGTFRPSLLDISVDEIASSCQKSNFKQPYASAASTAHACPAASSGKAAEQHASQHAARDPSSHTSHKTASCLLLKATWRRSSLLP
ncbi:MAG: hypothetical protein JJE30_18590 [Desulfuromonadales bacterium]|nr:hypothetical protein [Desulfuromonadales bacterium]